MAKAATISGNWTWIEHPACDGDPDALLLVTPNWNPGGGSSGIYSHHHTGVYYDTGASRWAVFNQDLAPMPEGAAFNVRILH